jgi:hypothetical protein
MTMTPFIRATQLAQQLTGHPNDLKAINILANLIRAAENDALERAAEAMLPVLRSMISRGKAADTIRALKHPDPTGGTHDP